jgi:amidase
MRIRTAFLVGALISAPAVARAQSPSAVDQARTDIAAITADAHRLNSVIAINPDWLAIATALDAERAAGTVRSAIHGRTILIKDNIETADRMATTAGSLALALNITRRDAPLVARIRAAGGVIMGKANLSEWANIRSSRSMSGWSAVGGIVRNPYARDRTACGSSSGSGAAIAAGLAWGAVGTETDGSIVCPASINGIVGLKPTLGLVSRTFVVPISHSQDTPGPMARTVRDTAMLLSAMAGTDPADTATRPADSHRRDYAAALTGRIAGLRIGVLRDGTGTDPALRATFDGALARLKAAGAILIDIATTGAPDGLGQAEETVLYTELKADLNAYLATTPPAVTARTLAAVIDFNIAHADQELRWFGQDSFVRAQATRGLSDPAYLKALATARGGARATLTRLMTLHKVAMLVTPTYGPAWLTDPVHGDQYSGPSASSLPAMSGFPHLTVPMGLIGGLPVGLSFIGPAWSEGALLNAGDVFETDRGPLPAPAFAASVSGPADRAP